MKSSVTKRNIVIDGHKTSVSLEDTFWNALKEIAYTQQTTLSELVAHIDSVRKQRNLSSAIRLFVLEHFRKTRARKSWTHILRPQLLNKGEQCSLRRTQARKIWTAGLR